MEPLLPGGRRPGLLFGLPDLRDYGYDRIRPELDRLGFWNADNRPPKADLREWFPPVRDQGKIGSCTAHARSGIVGYFAQRTKGQTFIDSPLFAYKTTRNIMQMVGDSGAYIRKAMAALVRCGTVEEKYWPYSEAAFDEEPPAFIYSMAESFQGLKYFCVDPAESTRPGSGILADIIAHINLGLPLMFGFYGFESFELCFPQGEIAYPIVGEKAQWAHAVVACGYDDGKVITHPVSRAKTEGALLIRNCWGMDWGYAGYGWLPYSYVLSKFASDFWGLISMEWVDSEEFSA